jgi:hypothetical protein
MSPFPVAPLLCSAPPCRPLMPRIPLALIPYRTTTLVPGRLTAGRLPLPPMCLSVAEPFHRLCVHRLRRYVPALPLQQRARAADAPRYLGHRLDENQLSPGPAASSRYRRPACCHSPLCACARGAAPGAAAQGQELHDKPPRCRSRAVAAAHSLPPLAATLLATACSTPACTCHDASAVPSASSRTTSHGPRASVAIKASPSLPLVCKLASPFFL